MAEMLKRTGIDFTVYEKGCRGRRVVAGQHFSWPLRSISCRASTSFRSSPIRADRANPRGQRDLGLYQERRPRSRLTKFIRFNEEIVAARFTHGRWHIDTD
jgi:hypothetical protein